MKGDFMAEEVKNESAPKDMIGFLDYYFVKKAPFQIPENAREWIVKYGPWINLVLMVMFLPAILAVVGLSSMFSSYALLGGYGYSYGMWYWVGTAVLVVQLVLQGIALPGLFARKMSGWTFLFYSQIVSAVYSIVTGSYIGAILGALVGFYVLFQIRAKYTK